MKRRQSLSSLSDDYGSESRFPAAFRTSRRSQGAPAAPAKPGSVGQRKSSSTVSSVFGSTESLTWMPQDHKVPQRTASSPRPRSIVYGDRYGNVMPKKSIQDRRRASWSPSTSRSVLDLSAQPTSALQSVVASLEAREQAARDKAALARATEQEAARKQAGGQSRVGAATAWIMRRVKPAEEARKPPHHKHGWLGQHNQDRLAVYTGNGEEALQPAFVHVNRRPARSHAAFEHSLEPTQAGLEDLAELSVLIRLGRSEVRLFREQTVFKSFRIDAPSSSELLLLAMSSPHKSEAILWSPEEVSSSP